MIKFVHKKHINRDAHTSKLVIYYNASDIFLGTLLMGLFVFFIHDYLSHNLGQPKFNGIYNMSNTMMGQNRTITPTKSASNY